MRLPNPESSAGLSAPDDQLQFSVNATVSCSIFSKAFVASAINCGLQCPRADPALSLDSANMPADMFSENANSQEMLATNRLPEIPPDPIEGGALTDLSG